MVRAWTIEVDGELGAALTGLAGSAGAGDPGLPVCQLAVEAAGDTTGFFDIGPVRVRRRVDGNLTALWDGHVALLTAGTLLDASDLTRAGCLGVTSQRLGVGGHGRADAEQDQAGQNCAPVRHVSMLASPAKTRNGADCKGTARRALTVPHYVRGCVRINCQHDQA